MKQSKFPPGWDEARVRRLLEHYEEQTEGEAVLRTKVPGKILVKPPSNSHGSCFPKYEN